MREKLRVDIIPSFLYDNMHGVSSPETNKGDKPTKYIRLP